MPVMTQDFLGRKPHEYRLLLGLEGQSNSRSLKTYKTHGEGYRAVEKVLKGSLMSSDDVIQTVKASGLRGRGGAGFPTGLKWSFVPKTPGEKYLITNFDEGEPGTYKDCYLAELSPHSLIEGKIIASYAIGAQKSYIYVRGEFHNEIKWCQEAIAEAYSEG
jgi:NADH-quinone oxidoreductase subunit F